MKKQDFHLGDVLSITTGYLVSLEHIGGVYKILGFMTNSKLWTHQLPSAGRLCKPHLLKQHPDLKTVEKEMGLPDGDNWKDWLQKCIERYGESREVQQLPQEDQLETDPFRDIPDGVEPIVITT